MEPEAHDELLDALPMHLRGKVLQQIEVDEDGTIYHHKQELSVGHPGEFQDNRRNLWHLAGWLLFSIPFTFIGLILLIPIFTFPLSFLIIGLGCRPFMNCVHTILVVRTQNHELEDATPYGERG